jgi:hypothetical protein
MDESEVLEGGAAAAAAHHFMSGVELEAISSGLPTPSGTETPYNPSSSEQQQQQQQQGGSEAAAAAAAAAVAAADDAAAGSDGAATTVAAGRPRRAIKMPQRLINSAALADRDGHDMVRCEGYTVGPPGCGLPGAQPFRVAVAPM